MQIPMRSIMQEYGSPRRDIRNAILMMRRRGTGYKDSVRAVITVNGAEAHVRWRMDQDMKEYLQSEHKDDDE